MNRSSISFFISGIKLKLYTRKVHGCGAKALFENENYYVQKKQKQNSPMTSIRKNQIYSIDYDYSNEMFTSKCV